MRSDSAWAHRKIESAVFGWRTLWAGSSISENDFESLAITGVNRPGTMFPNLGYVNVGFTKADLWPNGPSMVRRMVHEWVAYCREIRETKARRTAAAASGPTEFTSPYQGSAAFLSQGGFSSHSALGIR